MNLPQIKSWKISKNTGRWNFLKHLIAELSLEQLFKAILSTVFLVFHIKLIIYWKIGVFDLMDPIQNKQGVACQSTTEVLPKILPQLLLYFRVCTGFPLVSDLFCFEISLEL